MAPPQTPALLSEKVLSVTVRVPLLAMAPPTNPAPTLLKGALLPEKVLSVTVRVPPLLLLMAPPAVLLFPLAMVSFWTVNLTAESTENTATFPPPLMVITLPPSMVVSGALMFFVLVTIIVAAPPQLKVTVTVPPPRRQAFNAASSQLALVPVPTTHAKADQGAPSTAKASSARTTTSRARKVVVFTAGPEPGSRVRREAQRGPAATTPGTILAARRASMCASLLAVRR